MKKTLFVIFMAFITIGFSGCTVFVSGEKYQVLQRDFEAQIALNQTMKEEMRALREELITMRRELDAANVELKMLRRIAPPIPPDALQSLAPEETAAQEDEMSPPQNGTATGGMPAVPDAATESASSLSGETPPAPSEGTSSVSSVPPPAPPEGSSSASSVPPPNEKEQLKFQDIANTLGK